jgi:hypothetical protein
MQSQERSVIELSYYKLQWTALFCATMIPWCRCRWLLIPFHHSRVAAWHDIASRSRSWGGAFMDWRIQYNAIFAIKCQGPQNIWKFQLLDS